MPFISIFRIYQTFNNMSLPIYSEHTVEVCIVHVELELDRKEPSTHVFISPHCTTSRLVVLIF